MKIKVFFKVSLILVFVTCITLLTGYAEIGPVNANGEEEVSNITILSIEASNKELHFDYVTPSGPNSFYVVNDNEIYIADQYGKKINCYKNGILEKEICFPDIHLITDFYIMGDEIFLLDDYFPGAYRINDVICADMDGNIKYTINIPNDCAFLGKKQAANYDRRYRVNRIFDTDGYITCEFSDTEHYMLKDNKWLKHTEHDFQKNINKNTVTFSNWSNSKIQTHGEIEYAEINTTSRDIFLLSVGVADKNESSCFRDPYLYVVSEKGVSQISPVKTKADSVPVNQFFISQDNQIYQMYYDENSNVFVCKLKTDESYMQYTVPEIDSKCDFETNSKDKIVLVSYSSIIREQTRNRGYYSCINLNALQ